MSTSRKRLGRGLGALLGEDAVRAVEADEGIVHVAVARIRPNRFQPRQTFDEESIGDLAASIAQKGILQPLIVTPGGDGGYELVSGERRWRAAQRVGLATVPAIVREVEDDELLEIALIENLQREDLDAIEEAEGYRQLIDEFELTQAEVGTRVGKSRPAVANALRLLDLPPKVKVWVQKGELSAGHGRALLGLADSKRVVALAKEAVRKGLSVRQVESRVRRENADRRTKRADPGPADTAELERARIEEELQRLLGTRVTVRASKTGKGKIEIAFYSPDDLERLLERLGAKGE